jgi:threonine dehydrogenase-like Zn-dependent dehydrogenase
MKALFFDHTLSLSEIPVPEPAAGEVLVKLLYSAVCNTDLEILKGYMGFRGVLGHEFTGMVVTEGHPLSGKRVTGEINCPCHQCYLCITGRPTHCMNRTVVGIAGHQGVFAEYIALPEKNLHIIPEELDSVTAVFTEPLAAALEIFEQLHVRPSSSMIIFGAGKLGLLTAMVARLRGFDYLSVDADPAKTSFASGLGINAVNLESLAPGHMAEICIDCTGSEAGFGTAMKHLWPRGTLVLKTTVANPAAPDLNAIVINEFSILGSRCGPFTPAINLLARKLIDPSPMISARYPFLKIQDALAHASRQGTIKVLIDHSL